MATAQSKSRVGQTILFYISLALIIALAGLACQKSDYRAVTTQQTDATAKQQAESPSAKKNSQIGFASRKKFLDHYEKHGREFGSISPEEYLKLAQLLRDRPAGGEVIEIVRNDSVITRFDRATGAFLAFDSDLTIRTFFKPNDGEAYFRRQAKRTKNQRG